MANSRGDNKRKVTDEDIVSVLENRTELVLTPSDVATRLEQDISSEAVRQRLNRLEENNKVRYTKKGRMKLWHLGEPPCRHDHPTGGGAPGGGGGKEPQAKTGGFFGRFFSRERSRIDLPTVMLVLAVVGTLAYVVLTIVEAALKRASGVDEPIKDDYISKRVLFVVAGSLVLYAGSIYAAVESGVIRGITAYAGGLSLLLGASYLLLLATPHIVLCIRVAGWVVSKTLSGYKTLSARIGV